MSTLSSMKSLFRTRVGMTAGDGILMIFIIILSATLFVLIPRWVLSSGKELEIRGGDKVVGRYSFNTDRLIDVSGPLGTTSVVIKDGRARICSSPCPHKICRDMGDIGLEGGLLVCVPNKVIVTVTRERSDGLDAVTR